MPITGPELDAARRLTVERNLVRRAFEHLTADAFLSLPFEALGSTKTLLKRFFSTEPWGREDVEALADVVGPGEGSWRRELDPDLTLEYGWTRGRFGLTLASASVEAGPVDARSLPSDQDIAASFDGPVVPEATPNPRTIRFHVGTLPDDRRRWYQSRGTPVADPGVARLFAGFEEIANVLVGPDFVAVSLRRAADWEGLLLPVLTVVTEEFARPLGAGEGGEDEGGEGGEGGDGEGRHEEPQPRVMGGPAAAGGATSSGRSRARSRQRASRLDEAWRELGALRPSDAGDLVEVLAACEGDDPFRRQVAANLLGEADPAPATRAWSRLVDDPSRRVRRAAVDAMVDAGRAELRPLLERALNDGDAWIRWKALRGLVELGAAPSRDRIASLRADPDFRVRLEAASALRAG